MCFCATGESDYWTVILDLRQFLVLCTLIKHFINCYCVPATTGGIGDISVNKSDPCWEHRPRIY